MAACFLIFLYVSFETSYDNFHSKADRIYRIVTDTKTPSETIKHALTTAPITSISVAFSTISYQAIKAAIANPVKSLRTE